MSDSVYAEDLAPGAAFDLGEYTLTLADIIDFARRWDPQDFHVDESTTGFFGGVVASGLHSMAILQRLSVIGAYSGWAVLAGRRIREARFRAPARPDMTLHASLVIDRIDIRDDEKALVTASGTLTGDGVVVLTTITEFYLRRRP